MLLFASSLTQYGDAETLPPKTPLDDYVSKDDDAYQWKIIHEETDGKMKSVVIDLVSQTWRTEEDVNRTKWQHWLTVAIPDQCTTETAMLFIGGGSNGKSPPDGLNERTRAIAEATGAVVAELHMTPNQPLIFHDDGQRRTEDDLIGYTWDQFLKTGDPTWPARNPMVKGAVRAMDTLTAVTEEQSSGKCVAKKFVVAGGSKRGWTTWLTGAVDSRVVGIIPIVIDVLNVEASVKHHYAAYGFWAPSIGDYVEHQIPQRRDHPRMDDLYQLVDPYFYRHRLKMPKLLLNAAGDQFFPPDSSRHYFDELEGPKHLRYVPNADHSLDDTDAVETVAAYFQLILADQPVPQFTWTNKHDGKIRVETSDSPSEVKLWQAHNPDARDFRLESLGPEYESQLLESQGDGVYVAEVNEPEQGWTAYFVELTYEVAGGMPLKLTTDVGIIPDTLPHEDEDWTQPATITITCTSPSGTAGAEIESALEQAKLPGVADAIRCTITPGETLDAPGTLRCNWTPQGKFEMSALLVTQWLKGKGCNDFAYHMESGPSLVE